MNDILRIVISSGLFHNFKNSESRLDITCHVLNGIYSLLENSSR